ncbi:MAG: alpha/beta hydrolase [Candidatus Magasanikbacteria bacterium]
MKESLIILPGWGGTKETWQKFVDIAQQDFDVHVINLPCFGDEPCPEEVWGVEQYADFVKNKLSELRTPNSELILLGHSFGGAVALQCAVSNPDMFSKLILSGAAIFRPERTIRKIFFKSIARAGMYLFKLPFLEKFDSFAKKLLYTVAHSDYNETSGIKRDIFKKIIEQDRGELLPQVNIPTLLVHGTLDTYVPVAYARRATKLIPDAKLEIIDRGKHGLHIQQPEHFYTVIKQFAES